MSTTDTIERSVPEDGFDEYAPSRPLKRRRKSHVPYAGTVGRVLKIIALIIGIGLMVIGLGVILRAAGILNINLPFSTKTTVSTPSVVVPHFTIDDRYQIMHETTSFSVDQSQCRQFALDSCASGTLSATAKANVTQSLIEGKDYSVVADFNGHYATATKSGDVKLAITIWTQPEISDPDWDVNLITKTVKYQDTSSTLAGLWGTSVSQSQLESLAQAEAVRYAQTDAELFKTARAQVIAAVSRDAIKWGKVFGYVVHPTVVFGLRPGNR